MAPVVSRAPRKPQFAFDRPQHTAELVATADLELSLTQSMQRMYPAIGILMLAMAASDVHWFHHHDEPHHESEEVRGMWLLAGSLVLSAVFLVATPFMPAKWNPRLRRLLSFISHTAFGVISTMAPHSVWLPVGCTAERITVPFTLILLAMSPIVTVVEAIVSMLAILVAWGVQHYTGAESPLFTLLMAFVMGCGCVATKIQLYFSLRDDASRRTARTAKGWTKKRQASSPVVENLLAMDNDTLLLIDEDELVVQERVGAGAYGDVFRAKWHGKDVALKVMFTSPSWTDEERRSHGEAFLTEVKALALLRHPNVTLFMGACRTARQFSIVTEFVGRGSLWDVLHGAPARLSWELRRGMAVDAALGMNYLHHRGFSHGDLKSPNLLVTTNFHVKVADFSMARWDTQTAMAAHGARGNAAVGGSLLWVAPEILRCEHVDPKLSDAYAFGVCLWELLTRRVPFADLTHEPSALQMRIMEGARPAFGDGEGDAPHEWVSLIRQCWDGTPSVRPTFDEIVHALRSTTFLRMASVPIRSLMTRSVPSSHHGTSSDDSDTINAMLGAQDAALQHPQPTVVAGVDAALGAPPRRVPVGNGRTSPATTGGAWGSTTDATSVVVTVEPRPGNSGRASAPPTVTPTATTRPAEHPAGTGATIATVTQRGSSSESLDDAVDASASHQPDAEPDAAAAKGSGRHSTAASRLAARRRSGGSHRSRGSSHRSVSVSPTPAAGARKPSLDIRRSLSAGTGGGSRRSQHSEDGVTAAAMRGGAQRGAGGARRYSMSPPDAAPHMVSFSVDGGGESTDDERSYGGGAGSGGGVGVGGGGGDNTSRGRRSVDGIMRSHSHRGGVLAPFSSPSPNGASPTFRRARAGRERARIHGRRHTTDASSVGEGGGMAFAATAAGAGVGFDAHGRDDLMDERHGMLRTARSRDSFSDRSTGSRSGTASVDVWDCAPELLEWLLDPLDVTVLDRIAGGASGAVYRGTYVGRDVAIKTLSTSRDSMGQASAMLAAETKAIGNISHPNIVELIGILLDPPLTCVVLELMSRGNLTNVLQDPSLHLDWGMRLAIAQDIARGMHCLHGRNIIHRDLKSMNLLLDHDWTCKVADFGFARLKATNVTLTRVGTPAWVAPEVMLGQRYTEKVDVYSFGIVLWELLTRQYPYRDDTDTLGLMRRVVREGYRPPLPVLPSAAATDERSPYRTQFQFQDMIAACWSSAPTARPGFDVIITFLDMIVLNLQAARDAKRAVAPPEHVKEHSGVSAAGMGGLPVAHGDNHVQPRLKP